MTEFPPNVSKEVADRSQWIELSKRGEKVRLHICILYLIKQPKKFGPWMPQLQISTSYSRKYFRCIFGRITQKTIWSDVHYND